MAISYVHTLGDSTLDNLFWMINDESKNLKAAKRNSVEGKLQTMLNAEASPDRTYRVISHAYDGFTTSSVLGGDRVGDVLPRWDDRKQRYLQEKSTSIDHVVQPLTKLKEAIAKDPEATHYVVLSVGGNDFRENLLTPWRLISDISNVQERYLKIVQELKALPGRNIKPILMFQYRTDANNDAYRIYTILGAIGKVAAIVNVVSLAAIATCVSLFLAGVMRFGYALIGTFLGSAAFYASRTIFPVKMSDTFSFEQNSGVSMIGSLMEKFYQPILQQARKDAIPILDLPNTFNPFEKLYTSGIEPNIRGGSLIAEGLAHIISEHDFSSSSRLYAKSKPDEVYHGVENSDAVAWIVK
jgi:hypothetical protein